MGTVEKDKNGKKSRRIHFSLNYYSKQMFSVFSNKWT